MLMRRAATGFSLIELLITLAIFGFLAALAAPTFSAWVSNARVRGVAEALQNSIRLAQTEAVKRNRQVAFVLTAATPVWNATPSAAGKNWFIRVLPALNETADSTYMVQGDTVGTSAGVSFGATSTGDTPQAVLCFNSVGRLVGNAGTGLGANCTAPTSSHSYFVYKTGADRSLRVIVSLGGQVKMCDPLKALSSTNPDGCPP